MTIQGSNVLRRVLSVLVFAYVFSALAIPGILGSGTLTGLLAVVLFIALVLAYCVDSRQVFVGRWIVVPVFFVIHCGLLLHFAAFLGEGRIWHYLYWVTGWCGAMSVAVAVSSGVRINFVLNAMILAALANAVAVSLGFDAYFENAADLSVTSEQALQRASGMIGNPNKLAIYAIIPLFCILAWGQRASRMIWLVGLVCAVFAVSMTGSRKSVILLSLFLVALGARLWKLKNGRWAIRGAILLSGIGVVAFIDQIFDFFFANIFAFQRTAGILEGGDNSFSERIYMLKLGWSAFLDSPIWGHGYDMARVVTGTGVYTHNNALELAVNGGILLLASYYAMYVWIFLRLRKLSRSINFDGTGILFLLFALLLLDATSVTYDMKLIPLVILLIMSMIDRFPVEISLPITPRAPDRG